MMGGVSQRNLLFTSSSLLPTVSVSPPLPVVVGWIRRCWVCDVVHKELSWRIALHWPGA